MLGHSKEPFQWDCSFEHPKQMFNMMGKFVIEMDASEIEWQGFSGLIGGGGGGGKYWHLPSLKIYKLLPKSTIVIPIS